MTLVRLATKNNRLKLKDGRFVYCYVLLIARIETNCMLSYRLIFGNVKLVSFLWFQGKYTHHVMPILFTHHAKN